MKIQFFGNNTFGAFSKNAKVIFDPPADLVEKDVDFTTNSNGIIPSKVEAKKMLNLPGEYEISNILVKSLAQKSGKNVLFKVVMNGLTIVHCGEMTDTPDKNLFEELGEDIDILIVNISEKFTAKKIKDFLETVEPRVAFIGGDSSKFAELGGMVETIMSEDNPVSISRSSLSEEKSSYYILSV